MTIKRKVQKAVRRLVDKATDPATRKRAAAAVEQALKKGQETVLKYEKELTSPQTRAKLRAQWAHTKADLQHLKVELKKREKQAVAFTRKKPEQALALAAAVGLASGILVAALRRRRG